MNHWLWAESNHPTIIMPHLQTTSVWVKLACPLSVVRRQTVRHNNPDMPATWLLALPAGSERERGGGGEEEKMEGKVELEAG